MTKKNSTRDRYNYVHLASVRFEYSVCRGSLIYLISFINYLTFNIELLNWPLSLSKLKI